MATAASCDLYVANAGYYYDQLSIGYASPLSELTMTLGLLVYTAAVWSLQIKIRSDTYSNVEVQVDVGNRSNNAYLSDEGKPSYLLADPKIKPYRILSVDGRPVAYTDGHSAPGLAGGCATVFGPIGRLGHQAAHRPTKIIGGRTYAFLWPRTLALTPPQEIVSFHFDEKLEWTGALVFTPDDATYEIRSWLERFCGLKYEPAPQTVVVVWPPPLDYLSTQHLVIDKSSDSVVVQVNGGVLNQTLEVISKSNELTAYAGAVENIGLFLLNTDGVGEVEFISHGEDDSSLFLDLEGGIQETKVPLQVSFRFKSMTGEILPISAFDESAEYFINCVRHRTMSIIDIAIPAGANFAAFTKIEGLWVRQLYFSGKNTSFSSGRYVAEQVLLKIIEFLQDSKHEIKLDFGIFGCILCNRQSFNLLEFPKNALPAELRDRIRTFLTQFPVEKTRAYNVKLLDDDGLVDAFRISQGSRETLALKNTITSSIAKLIANKND